MKITAAQMKDLTEGSFKGGKVAETVKKEPKCEIQAFYQGGTKLRAALAITRAEAVNEINAAKKEVRDAVLETIEENEEIETNVMYLTRTNLLFYVISVQKPKSLIASVPALIKP